MLLHQAAGVSSSFDDFSMFIVSLLLIDTSTATFTERIEGVADGATLTLLDTYRVSDIRAFITERPRVQSTSQYQS